MIRPILTYPHPALTSVCEEVTEFDDELHSLVEDLFETMYANEGVGLAAPQVGVLKRVFVMDYRGSNAPHNPMAFINPTGMSQTLDSWMAEEGCLSLPGVFRKIVRGSRVSFCAHALNGDKCEYDLRSWEARIAQHEDEHLDGILITTRS